MQHQQRTNATEVRSTFMSEPLEFTMLASLVFLVPSGLAQHRPHVLAAVVPNQHRQQLISIKAIGLGAPRPAIDFDASGIDNDAVHAQLDEPTMQPPAISTCFVAAVHLRTRWCLEPLASTNDAIRQTGLTASGHCVTTYYTTAVAKRELPVLVTELKAQIEIARRRRFLPIQRGLYRRHFQAPFDKRGFPFYAPIPT
ncbi:hypothetical protein C7T35_36925 [Variovorax sp. WS11]|nr:hypothetical protein C7T35_36925 [Variovorax sp. WS11]